jgi:hypothetical protein
MAAKRRKKHSAAKPQPKGRWTGQAGSQKGKGKIGRGMSGRGIRLQTLFPVPLPIIPLGLPRKSGQ